MTKPSVIIPNSIKPPPSENEVVIANILAHNYKTTVEFIKPSRGYKQKTPDILMNGLMWEIKSPIGSGKRTVEVQIKSALKQSNNIILDGRLTKLDDKLIVKKVLERFKIHRRILRIIFVSKENKVFQIDKRHQNMVL